MPQARGFRQFGISFADYKVSIRNKWDGRGGMATLIPALGSCAGRMQTQCAGEQRLNANAHLAILLSKKHRPVDSRCQIPHETTRNLVRGLEQALVIWKYDKKIFF